MDKPIESIDTRVVYLILNDPVVAQCFQINEHRETKSYVKFLEDALVASCARYEEALKAWQQRMAASSASIQTPNPNNFPK